MRRKYRQKHREQDRKRKRSFKYKEWESRYLKQKRKIDIKLRINDCVRVGIRRALKDKKAGRHWETLVGYTIQDLIKHLEAQFDENMSWDNYASYWVIDHRKPKSLFNYKCPEDKEFKECWSLKNLQPLEKNKNLKKSNHYEAGN